MFSFQNEELNCVCVAENFLANFTPTINNLGKPRDFNGFTLFFGYNFENNLLLKELGFREENVLIAERKGYLNYCLQREESDNYFTPNSFVQKIKNQEKTNDNLAWLNSLYVDIDGIDNIFDSKIALKTLYDVCQRVNIKKPNIVVHTSTNPTVHLQIYWLLDPIYVYNNPSLLSWYTETTAALSEALGQESSFHIDFGVSTKASTYLRLPYTYNQKTKDEVYVLDIDIRNRRYTLSDSWLENLRNQYRKNQRFWSIEGQKPGSCKLLNHPQFQRLLEGVPEGFRNLSQYALAKACQADGLSTEESIEVVLAQNQKCSHPEKEKKVKDVVQRAQGVYGPEKKCLRNLQAEYVAETVNGAFGTDFEIDPSITVRYKSSIKGFVKKESKKRIKTKNLYVSKEETIRRVINTILFYYRKGKEIPRQQELAIITNVKYDSLKHYWPIIFKCLKVLQINFMRLKDGYYFSRNIPVSGCVNISIVFRSLCFCKKIVVEPVGTVGLWGTCFWFSIKSTAFHRLVLEVRPP